MLASGFLAGLIALATTAPAAEPPATEILQLDNPHSSAAFSVKVLWMFTVEGRFDSVHGEVRIDRFRSQARVDARIDAAEVTMNRESATTWVKSAEFFDVENYPEIRFRSEPFPLSRLHDGGELPGALTMRGVTLPVVFEVAPSTCQRVAVDCPVQATGTVKRSDFGMQSRRATLSNKVELSFSIRMSLPDRDAAES
ncbi:MAG TPA: YceI family protein [Dokdonella sp.]|uniref:YceI family protein n=1 Tax=Dokdonella sp. TaxID=2291710 RepID=UPI002D7E36AB|nr:YceI family protein [Dokdonella sp.]HET9032508.1 YceI family protein [Dokdonella sp.]